MKKISKLVKGVFGIGMVLLLSVMLIVDNKNIVMAETVDNALFSYLQKLEELNDELGTNYELCATEGDSYDELVSFYTEMTLSEFEQYIREAHETEMNDVKSDSLIVEPYSASSQRFYYDGTNYFYVDSELTVENGVLRYSGIQSTGSRIVSYPGYKMTSYDFVFQNSKRNVNCTWKCVKCVAQNVIAAGSYTKSCKFTAGGGNVYPTSTASN